MTDLSPQAQAVWNAYYDNSGFEVYSLSEVNALAAALVAAADQVVPEPAMILKGGRTYEAWTATVHNDIRNRLLTIAAELRGQDQQNSALSPPSEGD